MVSASRKAHRQRKPINRISVFSSLNNNKRKQSLSLIPSINGQVKTQQHQQQGFLHFSPFSDNQFFVCIFSAIPPYFTQEIFFKEQSQVLELARQVQEPKFLGFLPLPLWISWCPQVGLQSKHFDPIFSIPMYHNSVPGLSLIKWVFEITHEYSFK